MNYTTKLAATAAVLGMLIPAASWAALMGQINSCESGGLFATEQWSDCGSSLSWDVSQLEDGNWQYDYHWWGDTKELSHLTVGTSLTFTEENILEGTTSGWELGTWNGEGNSNFGQPGDLYGIKWDGDFTTEAMFTLISDRDPIWTSMFAIDGKKPGAEVFAYNTNFGQSSEASIYGDSPFGFILGPDTTSNGHKVPEPAPLAPGSLTSTRAHGLDNRRLAHLRNAGFNFLQENLKGPRTLTKVPLQCLYEIRTPGEILLFL